MSDLPAEARFLMNNAALVAGFDAVRQQAINAAMACAVGDDDGRRRYLDAARTVDKVRAHLAALMQPDAPQEDEISEFYTEQAKKRWLARFGL